MNNNQTKHFIFTQSSGLFEAGFCGMFRNCVLVDMVNILGGLVAWNKIAVEKFKSLYYQHYKIVSPALEKQTQAFNSKL